MSMRELRVEDALLYLDQVKVEFGDRPHIYNEFLDIMKTFKTQQIDTPGVIRRVSNLFQGNRKLVLGFNTFLPEGYKIELPLDGDGPPIAVFRAPGSNVAHVLHPLGPPEPPQPRPAQPTSSQQPPAAPPSAQQGNEQQHGKPGGGRGVAAAPGHPPSMVIQQRDSTGGGPSLSSQHGSSAHHHLDQQQQSQQQQRTGPPPPPNQQQRQQQPAPAPPQQQPAEGGGENGGEQAPMEFDHAINYVTTIKKRFASEPETYKKFLEILHTYQKEQRGIKEVLDEVSELFSEHPDLLKEFTYFLPDAVQAQAKVQLDAAAKHAEARLKRIRKQQEHAAAQAAGASLAANRQGAPMRGPGGARGGAQQQQDYGAIPVPFGATQGRTPQREEQIRHSSHFGSVSFAPVRPPMKDEYTPSQAAAKKGRPTAIPELPVQPNTAESTFFARAKKHLNRRELAADKPVGAKRHTPYTEFLKCLHLFGAGILNKEELVLLLRGLFMQGHAPKSGANAGGGVTNPQIAADATELLREFEEMLIGRGPYAIQETTFKNKSKYGCLRSRDFDFTGCDRPTPSYCKYPADYPHSLFISNAGQKEDDRKVLNDTYLCVGGENYSNATASLEEYDGIRARHNVYEETMFRIEDERYEVDMAIERNGQAMRQIEPFAEEVQTLREQEEQDGQPIGRMQYQLNHEALNSIPIGAIGRIYGERGDEVLQHLVRNPLIVLPIVYQRLKQKDMEWRKAKNELMDQWDAAQAANYEGCMDVRCYFYRRELERTFTPSLLLEQCRHARAYCKHPDKLRDHVATREFNPAFGLSSSDPSALLYQPYVAIQCRIDVSHKDAFTLVTEQLKMNPSVTALDREQIGRVWAEFILPWFGYPSNWVVDAVRASVSGKSKPRIVKYAAGQRVMTNYGEGAIVSCIEGDAGLNYRVKLPFGVANLHSGAVLYAMPSKDVTYVRRDGVMVREESSLMNIEARGGGATLGESYQLFFGTEAIYVFLRLYTLLCNILSDTREHCESFPSPQDPSKSYQSPGQQDDGHGESGEPHKPLSFSWLVSNLKRVISKDVDAKDFEAICRKVSKEKVHQMVAVPKLVERCVDALLDMSREDVVLNLYDLCHKPNDVRVDPVALRTQCLAGVPDASYRIQMSVSSGGICFSYLPKSEELITSSVDDDGDVQMNGTQKGQEAGAVADEDAVMEDADQKRSDGRVLDNGNHHEHEMASPNKRAKLK